MDTLIHLQPQGDLSSWCPSDRVPPLAWAHENGGGRVGGVRTAAAAFKLQRASYGLASHPCTPQGHTYSLAATIRPQFVVHLIGYRPSPGRTNGGA